ncbi:MAG: hypothetical protein ACOC5G_04490 [Acidobacteriota bacterium]
MGLIKFFKDAKEVQTMREEMGKLRAKTQHMIDILTATESDEAGAYKSNEYRTYRKAVSAINKKYNATDKWGCFQTGNIVDLRAAFIISMGINVSAKEKEADAEKELQWTKDFIDYNDLDKEIVHEFAKEAELEGKILLKIDIEKTPQIEKYKPYDYQMATVRFVSWLDKNYQIETEEDDYLNYKEVKWDAKGDSREGKLPREQFVYKKFGGRISEPNMARSKVMKCLTQIDNLDKALRDWREIDHIFASPILYAECETEDEVKAILKQFDNKNFKLKKFLAGTGKLSYLVFDIKGVEALEKEILTNTKMISGTTGISVQYLGLVELLKNRSTGDDQREMLASATIKERQTWEGAYEELITKAMNLFNEKAYKQKSTKLNPELIKVSIPTVTKEHWEHLEKVLMPANMAGKISDEFFLEQIPGMNVEEELNRKKEKEKSEMDRIMKENEDLKAEKEESELFGGNENAT